MMLISFVKWIDRFCFCVFAGVITTKARIDYESIKQIYVNAYVSDTGIPQLTSTAEIIVDIINANDNEPVFSLPEYRFSVPENSAKGTFIGKINAKDGDDGKLNNHKNSTKPLSPSQTVSFINKRNSSNSIV